MELTELKKETLKPQRVPTLEQIPVLHVRGTNYEVGFAIGRQFRSIINDLLANWGFLNEILIPTYGTKEGRKIYDDTLTLCERKFPNYVCELKGMSAGAQVPFFKLFLMHLESVMVPPNTEYNFLNNQERSGTGCTSIICNVGEILLGHTEDTSSEFANNVYIVAAEILNGNGELAEKFSTLTYAGHLPGYTMGFNHHGMIYSINTLYPTEIVPGNTPRTFLTRAILGASSLPQVQEILLDAGTGTSDGFSLNITFVTKTENNSIWHNIEVAPPNAEVVGSQLNIFEIREGQYYAHCNRYLRIAVPQAGNREFNSSGQRMKAIKTHEKPTSIKILKGILSDKSDQNYPIFRNGRKPDLSITLAAGIFDVANRKWLIFTKQPTMSNPVATIHMEF